MSTEQPKALMLANRLEKDPLYSITPPIEAAAELRRLHAENVSLRRCALKYLDYLGVGEPNEALAADLSNPEMVGCPAKAKEQA